MQRVILRRFTHTYFTFRPPQSIEISLFIFALKFLLLSRMCFHINYQRYFFQINIFNHIFFFLYITSNTGIIQRNRLFCEFFFFLWGVNLLFCFYLCCFFPLLFSYCPFFSQFFRFRHVFFYPFYFLFFLFIFFNNFHISKQQANLTFD